MLVVCSHPIGVQKLGFELVGAWQHSAKLGTLVASIDIGTMAMYGVC